MFETGCFHEDMGREAVQTRRKKNNPGGVYKSSQECDLLFEGLSKGETGKG